MMKNLILTLAAALLLTGVAPKNEVTIGDAWVREPNPARSVTAAFMTLENPTDHAIAMVGASSTAAEVVEMHEMTMAEGTMSMRQVDRIEIPANGRVKLEPGGLHLMLINLKGELRDGALVDLVLRFDDGTAATVRASVRAAEHAH